MSLISILLSVICFLRYQYRQKEDFVVVCRATFQFCPKSLFLIETDTYRFGTYMIPASSCFYPVGS